MTNKYKGTHTSGTGRWETKTYTPLTADLLEGYTESDIPKIKAEIAKEAKTANSRLRRNTQSGVTNIDIGDKYTTSNGFFKVGTTGESLEDLKKHLLTIRNYLAKGLTRVNQGVAKPPKSKQVQTVTQAEAKQYTAAELKKLIKSEGKTANSRLRRIVNNGLLDSPLIADKWRNIKNNPFGTDSGYFKLGTKGESLEEMQLHYMTIIDFLTQGYTIQGLKSEGAKFANKIGVDVDTGNRILNILRDLRQMGYSGKEVYNVTDVVKDYTELNMSTDWIIEQSETAIKKERERQKSLKDHFQKRAKKFKNRKRQKK